MSSQGFTISTRTTILFLFFLFNSIKNDSFFLCVSLNSNKRIIPRFFSIHKDNQKRTYLHIYKMIGPWAIISALKEIVDWAIQRRNPESKDYENLLLNL